MSTEKIKLKSVKVEYVKGKYAYKQRKNVLDRPDIEIVLSGNYHDILRNRDSSTVIDCLYEEVSKNLPENSISLKALDYLKLSLGNTKLLESKGITHLIVYKICLNK